MTRSQGLDDPHFQVARASIRDHESTVTTGSYKDATCHSCNRAILGIRRRMSYMPTWRTRNSAQKSHTCRAVDRSFYEVYSAEAAIILLRQNRAFTPQMEPERNSKKVVEPSNQLWQCRRDRRTASASSLDTFLQKGHPLWQGCPPRPEQPHQPKQRLWSHTVRGAAFKLSRRCRLDANY